MFANQERATVTEFGADPRDGVFQRLTGRLWNTLQSKYTAPYLPADDDPNGRAFTGLHNPVQAFMGADFLAANYVQYNDGGFPMIDTGLIEGPYGDPARRIFADRLRRRGGLQ
ncbi:hypothetical protein ABZ341_41730 [Streptomyces sp. NPDC006173]|uniref:hypothetical protein n=1 Tax=Streptomyces sp. NPDC006173 TaxID=3155349 RepID=UPI0034042D65